MFSHSISSIDGGTRVENGSRGVMSSQLVLSIATSPPVPDTVEDLFRGEPMLVALPVEHIVEVPGDKVRTATSSGKTAWER